MTFEEWYEANQHNIPFNDKEICAAWELLKYVWNVAYDVGYSKGYDHVLIDNPEIEAIRRFISGEKPSYSHSIAEYITAGYGHLDEYGEWEFPLCVDQDTLEIYIDPRNYNV